MHVIMVQMETEKNKSKRIVSCVVFKEANKNLVTCFDFFPNQ